MEYLLIIAPAESSYDLARAALKVTEEFKVPIRVCVMWSADTREGVEELANDVSMAPWENYMHVMEVKKSPTSSSWWEICTMTKEGAILVRPDEHIAWRVKTRVFGDPIEEMERVFTVVLGGRVKG